MLRDLRKMGGEVHEADCDVFIVGGGIAGLLLATRLAALGRHVVVAESGDKTQPEDIHPLNEVEQIGQAYSGAQEGRARCLGGTSTRWGGAMLPFLPRDMASSMPGWDIDWPVTLDDFTGYQREVEQLFDLPGSPYERPEIMPVRDGVENTFIPRLGKWPPFKLRNVATLFREQIESQSGPTVFLNATVTAFKFDPGGTLAAVDAQGDSGPRLRIRARETIIAAGAIESTRLLLLADRQHDDRIFASDDVLGHYFHDHLSAPTARLSASNRKALNRITGFRFEGKGMRNLRFEPSDALRTAHRLPAAFTHVGLATETATGFDVLRTFYRKIQRQVRPSLGDWTAFATALPWLSRAVWWRFVEKRLLFPDGADFQVHMVVEQQPLHSNRIALSATRRDVFGCPLASIDWHVGEDDVSNAIALTEHFISAWNGSALASLATAAALPSAAIGTAMTNGGGIYHPGGTARMGATPAKGVVDKDLRTFRVPNLSVVSTAVFPSGGGANPTMMLMMAALRAADRIATQTARALR